MKEKTLALNVDNSPCDDIGVLSSVEFICPHCNKKVIANRLITYDEYFYHPEYILFKCSKCGKETDVYFIS